MRACSYFVSARSSVAASTSSLQVCILQQQQHNVISSPSNFRNPASSRMTVQGVKRAREDTLDHATARDTSDAFEVPDPDVSGAAGKQQQPTSSAADAARRVSQRLKQIEFGKSTLGYDAYRRLVPLAKRVPGRDPVTPDAHSAMPKRAFDAARKAWRRQLHTYDPPEEDEEKAPP
jgi:histone RNA hairpin-binding protein